MSKDKMTPEFYTTLPWRIAAKDYKTAFYLVHGKREDGGELQILTIKDGPHPVKEHLDRMKDNASAIVSAVNNTYGKSIDPQVVPTLLEALKNLVYTYEGWGKSSHSNTEKKMLESLSYVAAKQVIEQATLK